MVQERKFCADLYYRLNIFPSMLPPLRERSCDVRLLTAHFVERVRDAMERFSWPNNIRELQNFIERSVILTSGTALATLRESMGVVGGRNGAAAMLGMPRTTLISKMRKFRISMESTDHQSPASAPLLQAQLALEKAYSQLLNESILNLSERRDSLRKFRIRVPLEWRRIRCSLSLTAKWMA
jgi:transcriptional regulator with GAF, ATPase, and Fis domain